MHRWSTCSLFDKLGDDDAALCTHGDVVGEVLQHCVRHGIEVDTGLLTKGSTWVLDTEAGAIVGAVYVPPPE